MHQSQPRLADSVIAGHWSVVVAGGRIAGAACAWALAPYADRVLVVDASQATTFWPQQSTWDRQGNLAWAELGLLDTVLECGAPRTFGHTLRTDDTVVEHEYPQQDDYSFRMSVAREVLDPALLHAARSRGNVTVIRPARVREVVMQAGRVCGAVVRRDGVDHRVSCDLLVLADGRLSRTVTQLDAAAYRTVQSSWFALLAYYQDLPLPTDRGYFALQGNNLVIATPCGHRQWCISTDMLQDAIDRSGRHPMAEHDRIIRDDPHLAPAVTAGRRISSVGGAGKLRMLRRPMSGPGWCLVGDVGYHLDPVTAGGTRAALVTAAILRDRIAELGGVIPVDATALSGLTELRDAALEEEWIQTEQIVCPAMTSR